MKNVGIQHACSEDWNKMTPTDKGAFCRKCAKQVYDFTNKPATEIKQILLELKDQEICGRMTFAQEKALNLEFEEWIQANRSNFQRLFITALLIVFGLTLFSCEDERDQHKIANAQTALTRALEAAQQTPAKEVPVETPLIFIPPNIVPVEIVSVAPDPEIPYLEIEEELDEVQIIGYEDEQSYVTSGVMVMHNDYRNYLEKTTPAIETDENGIPYPTEFKALAFPNPAVENTTLEIQSPHKERMDINLYDTSGKLIREIHSGKIPKGTFRQSIDLNDLNSGVYLVIIQSRNFKETVRIVKN